MGLSFPTALWRGAVDSDSGVGCLPVALQCKKQGLSVNASNPFMGSPRVGGRALWRMDATAPCIANMGSWFQV